MATQICGMITEDDIGAKLRSKSHARLLNLVLSLDKGKGRIGGEVVDWVKPIRKFGHRKWQRKGVDWKLYAKEKTLFCQSKGT